MHTRGELHGPRRRLIIKSYWEQDSSTVDSQNSRKLLPTKPSTPLDQQRRTRADIILCESDVVDVMEIIRFPQLKSKP